MRHGRAKAARRTLQFFERTVGIRPPYHVLLDGTFVVAIVKSKIPLRERFGKMLQHASFTMYMTKSSLDELRQLCEAASNVEEKQRILKETLRWIESEDVTIVDDVPDFGEKSKDILKNKYNIEQSASPAGLDLLKLTMAASSPPTHKPASSKSSHDYQRHHHATTYHHYFVACQDEAILDMLRNLGTVPVLRLARGSVLLLENPSKVGQQQASHDERRKWMASGSVPESEKQLVDLVKKQQRQERQQQQKSPQRQHHNQYQERKKRKAKEPNPLSCKKSKPSKEEPSKKRRRKRKSEGAAPES